MPNLNYHGLFREIVYILLAILSSLVGVSSIVYVYNHTGLFGAVFFSIIIFLASRLIFISSIERGGTHQRNHNIHGGHPVSEHRQGDFNERSNCGCARDVIQVKNASSNYSNNQATSSAKRDESFNRSRNEQNLPNQNRSEEHKKNHLSNEGNKTNLNKANNHNSNPSNFSNNQGSNNFNNNPELNN